MCQALNGGPGPAPCFIASAAWHGSLDVPRKFILPSRRQNKVCAASEPKNKAKP